MNPVFKQSGLIWTLLNTSIINNILFPIKLVWSNEKIGLSL